MDCSTTTYILCVGVWKQREEGCTYSGRLELWAVTSSVWDGAGRSNGWAHSERCLLIEMGSSGPTEKQTDITRPRDRACGRTDSLAVWQKAGKR